jgi:outer membrane lipoprotein SlyB
MAGFDPDVFGSAAQSGGFDPDVFSVPASKPAAPAVASAAPSAAVSAGKDINSIPRQIGLTARYALEGPANMAQIVTEPLRYVTDRLTGQTGKTLPLGELASRGADWLGLPKPEGADERVVADATRLGFGAGGMAKASQLVADAIPTAARYVAPQASRLVQWGADALNASRNVPQALSTNLPQQFGSAAGAGLAGGASREAGGTPLMQGAAALAGGVAGGYAGNPIFGAIDKTVNAVMNPRQAVRSAMPSQQQIDVQISAIMERAGVDYSQVPERVRQSLRADLSDALNTGREIDPAAVRRLADFRMTNTTPTRGAITQDPVQITREMNLAKTGANSADGELQGLARVQNQNNATLIQRLNDAGGRSETEPVAAGRAVASSVLGRQADLRGAERGAWNEARNSPAYTQPIYPDGLNAINRALGDEGMMGFMNPTISRYMEAFQTGQQPFTPQAYRNLQSMLSNELAKGGNEAAAARIARNALEATPIQPINNPRGVDFGNLPVTGGTASAMRAADAQPTASIEAIDRARGATRAAYAYEESSPLVRSVLSDGRGADPVRIAQQFVIGGTPDEAAVVAREVGPAGLAVIKDALATHIKKQALSGANDEVGKVSQSALNAVLRKIGDEKLRLFFSPEELAGLHSASRVASYVQVQPVGSAVNNSNSGALLLGKAYDTLMGAANATPLVGPWITQPLSNGIRGFNTTIQTNRAQNVLPGLLMQQPRRPVGQGLLLPAIAGGGTAAGLLAAP